MEYSRSRKSGKEREVAERLLADWTGREGEALPPLAELAKSYRVSYVTLWKAVRGLAEKGLFSSGKGRRTIFTGALDAGKDPPIPPGRNRPAAWKLAQVLRLSILEGRYKAGEALPKFTYLAQRFRASHTTVTEAFRLLEAEKLCRREGKRRLVGTELPADESTTGYGGFPSRAGDGKSGKGARKVPRPSPNGGRRQPPVVLLLDSHATTFEYLHVSERTSPFMSSFHEEMDRWGMQTLLATIDGPQGRIRTYMGPERLEETVRELGPRYRGAMVFATKQHVPDLEAWLRLLLGTGRPAVWFDRRNQGLTPGAPFRHPSGARLYRCHHDEAVAVEKSLATLVGAGHRIIGIPNHLEKAADWVENRASRFREAASRLPDPPRVLVHNDPRHHVRIARDLLPEELHRQLRPHCPPWAGRILDEIHDRFPTAWKREMLGATLPILHLLRDGATALLLPNDSIASHYLRWCKAFAVSVPRELSLLSFDNDNRFRHLPISSVDFGIRHQGYAAAHVFIGDLSPSGGLDMEVHCRVANRGSVDEPSASPPKLRFFLHNLT